VPVLRYGIRQQNNATEFSAEAAVSRLGRAVSLSSPARRGDGQECAEQDKRLWRRGAAALELHLAANESAPAPQAAASCHASATSVSCT
jgi:hypothetical protein